MSARGDGMTAAIRCTACGGSGEIPVDDNREPLIGGKWCPAWFEYPTHTLNCLIEGYHDGPHHTIDCPPCRSCGGMDRHTDWCPDHEMVTDEIVDIHFDDEGRFWFPEPVEFANCWRYDPAQSGRAPS